MHEPLLSAMTNSKQLAIKAGPPPTIIVVYDCYHHRSLRSAGGPRDPTKEEEEEELTGHDGTCIRRINILRRKTIRLHNLASSSDSAEEIVRRLARTFPHHLGPKVVNQEQLQRLILKLRNLLVEEVVVDDKKAAPVAVPVMGDASEEKQHQDQDQEEGEGEDLNRASDAELAAAKMRMSVMFEQNRRQPGSAGYVHDVRRDFDQAEEDCGWDDDDDDDDDDDADDSS